MTNELFVKWSEGYFSEYRPVVEKEVLKLLSSWDEDLIDELRAEAMNTISTSFKTPPDIFFINHSVTAKMKGKRHESQMIQDRQKRRMLVHNQSMSATEETKGEILVPPAVFKDLFHRVIDEK